MIHQSRTVHGPTMQNCEVRDLYIPTAWKGAGVIVTVDEAMRIEKQGDDTQRTGQNLSNLWNILILECT